MVYKSVDHGKLWSICFLQQHLIFLRKTKNQHSIFLVKQLLRVYYYYYSLLSFVHNELALFSSWFLRPYNFERETSTRSFFYFFPLFIPFYFSVSQGSGFCPYRGKVLSRVLHFIDRKRPSPCKQYLGQNGE